VQLNDWPSGSLTKPFAFCLPFSPFTLPSKKEQVHLENGSPEKKYQKTRSTSKAMQVLRKNFFLEKEMGTMLGGSTLL
jgi:hypothetical protein